MLAFLSLTFANVGSSQTGEDQKQEQEQNPKQKDHYLYWGYNRASYAVSSIHFKGSNHDFTLKDVKASDRPTHFDAQTYLLPPGILMPQYNFRYGHRFEGNIWLSFGMDHMKYVVDKGQTVHLNGDIEGTESYDGIDQDRDIVLDPDFLTFEHTDGLNYSSFDIEAVNALGFVPRLSLVSGVGLGFVVPRSDVRLFKQGKNHPFKLTGWGYSASAGLELQVFSHGFIRLLGKTGILHLNCIPTTGKGSDSASQDIIFSESILVLGRYF